MDHQRQTGDSTGSSTAADTREAAAAATDIHVTMVTKEVSTAG